MKNLEDLFYNGYETELGKITFYKTKKAKKFMDIYYAYKGQTLEGKLNKEKIQVTIWKNRATNLWYVYSIPRNGKESFVTNEGKEIKFNLDYRCIFFDAEGNVDFRFEEGNVL